MTHDELGGRRTHVMCVARVDHDHPNVPLGRLLGRHGGELAVPDDDLGGGRRDGTRLIAIRHMTDHKTRTDALRLRATLENCIV